MAGAPAAAGVSAALWRTCFVASPAPGQMYCWGDNGLDPNNNINGVDYSQPNGRGLLGTGSLEAWVAQPQAVLGVGSWTTVSAGVGYSCGVNTAAVAMCWGVNAYGQFGDGSTQWRSHLAPVAGNLSFSDVQVAWEHACGLTVDGSIWCWGRNAAGQLGNGSADDSRVPVRVAADGPFLRLSVGRATNCAITTTGETWCWGNGNAGQIGDGALVSRSAPVRVRP